TMCRHPNFACSTVPNAPISTSLPAAPATTRGCHGRSGAGRATGGAAATGAGAGGVSAFAGGSGCSATVPGASAASVLVGRATRGRGANRISGAGAGRTSLNGAGDTCGCGAIVTSCGGIRGRGKGTVAVD